VRACAGCVRKAQLLRELTPGLDRPARGRPPLVLALEPEELAVAVQGPRAPRPASLRRSDDDLLSAAWADERELGVESICLHDEGYPARLRALPDPPAVLHVLGGLDRLVRVLGPTGERPTISMVGARRAPDDGLRVARRFGEALAGAGITVISGMAFGIDAASHEGALAAGSPDAPGVGRPGRVRPGGTVAVLAGGPEKATPATLRGLHARIARDGAVVSELPPGASPRRWSFPARNRLIAALGDGLLVTAAARGSGSLRSVEHAHALERPVGAVPGSVLDPAWAGGNDLLRGDDLERDGDGPGRAWAITAPDDVRLMLRAEQPQLPLELDAAIAPVDPLVGLDGHAREIARRLLSGARTIESLIAESDAPTILAGLGALEASGRLRRSLGGELELLVERADRR
jgi:DNA processing protein